ncbi:MAG: LPP20 family lipoprotein [Elusimicrobiota bacterium]
MTRKRLLPLLLLAAACVNAHAARQPHWVKQRPVNDKYYTGIGNVSKTDAGADYVQSAKNRALGDLASQILVTVQSGFIDAAVERSGLTETDVRSEIRASAQAVLEDYDCAETWEDKREYWTYCRLSKAAYAAAERGRIDQAKLLALDLFKKARASREAGDISRALTFYVQALQPIQHYPGRPLETELAGKQILLGNEIYAELQDQLSRIELVPDAEKVAAIEGRPVGKAVGVTALIGKRGVPGLPLRCGFLRGAGRLVERVRTGSGGEAICDILKLQSAEKTQLIEARLDPADLGTGSDISPILRATLNRFAAPRALITLQVSGLPIFLEADEKNLGEALDTPYLETRLRRALTEKGCLLVDDPAQAELLLKLQARSRRGTELHGIASAFVDASVSLADQATGEEIYQGTLQDVKGMNLDYPRAGLKAFAAATKRIDQDLLPPLLERIQSWKER